MKVGKWTTLVIVLVLLFSVGCATGAATGPPTNIGHAWGGGGYRNVTP